MYYTKNGEYPKPLPNRIRLLGGQTRTLPFSKDDIIAAGYREVDPPPVALPHQKLEWSGSSWLIFDKSQQDIIDDWTKIRYERDKRINDFEWRYMRYYRNQRLGLEQVDDLNDMDQYIQELCDITKQNSPYNIQWPEYESKKNT
jgi:hypothetical protein